MSIVYEKLLRIPLTMLAARRVGKCSVIKKRHWVKENYACAEKNIEHKTNRAPCSNGADNQNGKIYSMACEKNRTAHQGGTMEYTRQYARYPTHREAFYCLHEKMAEKQECTIINISRKGMGVVFHKIDGINIGVTIRIEIPVATALDSISVNGMVKWVDKMESNYVGGIELNKELSDVKFSKLC